MKLLLIICALIVMSSTYGQERALTIGPVVSYDYNTLKLLNGYSSTVKYSNSISYGVDLSYLAGRVLFDLKVMTTNRKYTSTSYIPYAQPTQAGELYKEEQVQVGAQYYAVPVTASYRIVKSNRLQIFTGVGLIAEWVLRDFNVRSLDIQGSTSPIPLTNTRSESNLSIGGSLQGVFRYRINDVLYLQLEPTLRYYPEVRTPYASGSRRSSSALLTLAYKLH